MELFFFYTASFVALTGALCVITLPKPVHALLALLAVMFSLSILYLLLGAQFVAMVNLIVYAGAVLVLFLFVIMLQGLGAKDLAFHKRFHLGYLILVSFVAIAFFAVILSLWHGILFWSRRGVDGTIETVGRALFREHLLAFELTSFLLLLGVFAAVALAKRSAHDPD